MKKSGRIHALALTVLVAAALAVPFALAQSAPADQGQPATQGREHRFGKHRWGGGEGRMFSRLNLTEAQRAQIKQLHQSFRERTEPLRQELRAKREEIRQANQGAFNEALTAQKLAGMSGLEAKLMGEQYKLRQETLAVLTPEQKTQLEQEREQFKSRRGERRTPRTE